MSVKMMGIVWDSDLPRPEKLVLLAYADKAEHDGTSIFPSHGRVAWMTGYGKRQVIRITNKLLAAGILEEIGWSKYGTILYHMHADVLSPLPPYIGGVKMSSHDKKSTGGGNILSRNGVKMTSNPSVRDPSVRDPSKEYSEILEYWRAFFPDKPQPRPNNKTLKAKLQTRLKNPHFKENWRKALSAAQKSGFLHKSSWFDLGWFLKNDTHYENCLDGKYNDTRPQGATVARAKPVNPGGGAV